MQTIQVHVALSSLNNPVATVSKDRLILHKATTTQARSSMPYVPPHLRGAASTGNSEPEPSSTSSAAPSSNRGGYGGGGGGGFGGQRPTSGYGRQNDGYGAMNRSQSQSSFAGGGMSRSGSQANLADGDQTPKRGGLSRVGSSAQLRPEPVFVPWTPSDRVTSLSEEQIVDIRQRLNVTVVVPEGQPPAASPIESFHEMVRS